MTLQVRQIPEIGERVLLRGKHPWAGRTGRCVEITTWRGRPAASVELDLPGIGSQYAGVTERSQWTPILAGGIASRKRGGGA